MKLSSDKNLTWKICLLSSLASAKRVSELHASPVESDARRVGCFVPSLFVPDFVPKTQNPSVYDQGLRSSGLQYLHWPTL